MDMATIGRKLQRKHGIATLNSDELAYLKQCLKNREKAIRKELFRLVWRTHPRWFI